MTEQLTSIQVAKLVREGKKLPLATQHYLSRGQSHIQELYQTSTGKIFIKTVSNQNHTDCRINPESGTLAEREYWAYSLGNKIGLKMPTLWLLDKFTTAQRWLDLPDARQFISNHGTPRIGKLNIFNCSIFDWFSGQSDRHDGNFLYDIAKEKITLIDSAFCFQKHDGTIPDYLKLFELGGEQHLERKIKSKTLDHLLDLPERTIRALVPLRDPDELSSLLRRQKRLENTKTISNILTLFRG